MGEEKRKPQLPRISPLNCWHDKQMSSGGHFSSSHEDSTAKWCAVRMVRWRTGMVFETSRNQQFSSKVKLSIFTVTLLNALMSRK